MELGLVKCCVHSPKGGTGRTADSIRVLATEYIATFEVASGGVGGPGDPHAGPPREFAFVLAERRNDATGDS